MALYTVCFGLMVLESEILRTMLQLGRLTSDVHRDYSREKACETGEVRAAESGEKAGSLEGRAQRAEVGMCF